MTQNHGMRLTKFDAQLATLQAAQRTNHANLTATVERQGTSLEELWTDHTNMLASTQHLEQMFQRFIDRQQEEPPQADLEGCYSGHTN